VIVQLYGVTTAADAAMVAALGPDHVGVVLDEGVDTWDSVDEPTMRAVVRELTRCRVVALSLSTDRDRVLRTVEQVEPQIVHVVRAVGGLGIGGVADLRTAVAPVELMVTIPVRGPEVVDDAAAFAPVSDFLLLDTAHSETGIVGASGQVHDWSWSRAVVDAVDVPVVLAGGLGPDNVVAAIEAVQPAGVDSETHTGRDDDRRRRDPEKVRAFIERARASG
jgi:phosphoribosylanthranilate isomerase